MTYLFDFVISIPGRTDLNKTINEFSSFGDIKEYNDEIYDFDGFKIEDIYNGSLFLEELDITINLKLDIFFFDCAFVFLCFQIDSDTLIDIEKLNDSFFTIKRNEFNQFGIESISDFPFKFVLSRFYDFTSFKDVLKNVDLDMNHAERWNKFQDEIKLNTCLIPNRYMFSMSTENSSFYIENKEYKDEELIIDTKKLKLWEEEDCYYYSGDKDQLIVSNIYRRVLSKKLNDCIFCLRTVLNEITDQSKKIIIRLTNPNPIYWQDLSLAIEADQLYYMEVQKLNYNLISRFMISTGLEKYYTENSSNKVKNEVNRKVEIINQLSNQVEASFKNISTPIKSKNDFKLQESTDKVNDRILFLSFIAMCLPLIASITSKEILNEVKIISGSIILLLPILYYFSIKLYRRKEKRSNQLDVLKNEFKEQNDNIKKNIELIKQIESYDDEKQKRYQLQIEASKSNIKLHEAHIDKIKEKLG